MKYTIEMVIELPVAEVIAKFDSVENMKHWQRGLQTVEHISGTPGEVGAKMKMVYQMGKRKMELIETITHKNLPFEFHSTYDTKGMRSEERRVGKERSTGWVRAVYKLNERLNIHRALQIS